MAEPFKNAFNTKMIAQMGGHFLRVWPEFNKDAFVDMATSNLDDLELKERSNQITEALTAFLPKDFEQAVNVMLDSLAPYNKDGPDDCEQGITGWGTLPMNRYISLHGLGCFDLSMAALKEITSRFSAEFDIRFFLIAEEERTLSVLKTWINDRSHHVRRLVSEGTRPRLPWAMKLPSFVEDPSPILPLLESLRDDEEEYVRRSVANNLNDIAKDHPDVVADIAKEWLKDADKNRVRLVKHACRTLIKQGHQATLEALGYGPPEVVLEVLNMQTPCVKFGDALVFDIALHSTSKKPQSLVIDYAVHHRKANSSTSPKVFKWKNITLKPSGELRAVKKHRIKKITTRTYYNGVHSVEIFVNGVSLGQRIFELYDV